jgi:hypothetical protein
MKQLGFVCLAAVLFGVTAQCSVAQQAPEFLDHYRLVPRSSTLHQTGGFAGVDLHYRLRGEYDFRHGTGPSAKAAFDNAEIWGSIISDQPTPAYVIEVDEILNLEGLIGEALPVGAPFDVYQFRGHTSDGSSVELLAAVMGPWMYLRGATQPPPGSADYFTYRLRALARSGPFADFNDDGVVDAADFVALRKSRGAGSNDLTAGAGFAEWRGQFGETLPDVSTIDTILSAAVVNLATTSAVPEPASLSFAIYSGLLVACLRRRV